MGTQLPSPKGAQPQFLASVRCCQKMPLAMEVGLSPGDFVFDGDPAPLYPLQDFKALYKYCIIILPPEKKGTPTQFLAHVYCGQMAG